MFGCARTVGCAVIAVALAAGAYVTRDMWLPRITGRSPDAGVTWEKVGDDRGAHARSAVESLGRKGGPVFANLTAADVTSLLLAEARRRFPASVEGAEAAVVGDRLLMRATVDLSELRALDALGPVGAMLGSRQRLAFGGRINVLRPGLAEFRVDEAKIGELIVPPQAIPKLIAQLDREARPAGISPNGIPFALPEPVGDVRVGRGRVTLYKNTK
jgi:hypothetical protein